MDTLILKFVKGLSAGSRINFGFRGEGLRLSDHPFHFIERSNGRDTGPT